MGLFDSIGDAFSEFTGFGGKGNPDPHNLDPAAWQEMYNQALAGVEGVGNDEASKKMRGSIENSAQGMLDDLENNAGGRKANFQEDMARGFSADMQSKARSAGGTGNLASVLNPSGGAYDSQARAQSRGLNDLYSAAVADLGNLSGVQNQLYGQDMGKQMNKANIMTGELANRRGIAANNNENTFNSEQAGRDRRMNTYSGIAKSGSSFGKMMSGGGMGM